ncbi:MAG: hypothetical protein M1817_002825 [Caeruleum heppii]|nr:MAG: hypothetical protein M1817_002825 [Caeruleum heppii]
MRLPLTSCILLIHTLISQTRGVPTKRDDSNDTCAASTWRPSAEAWRRDHTDSWLAAWWSDRSKEGKDQEVTSVGFVDTLVRDYAPRVDDFICNVNRQCSIHSCDEVAEFSPNARQAYFALTSIGNFNDFMRYYYEGINVAQAQDNSFGASYVKVFSEAGVPKNNGFLLREILNAIAVVVAIAFVMIPGGQVAGAGIIAATVASNLPKVGEKVATGFIGAISLSVLAAPEISLEKLSVLGEWIGIVSKTARNALSEASNSLLMGERDDGGRHLWDYLADGTFTKRPKDESASITKFLTTVYTAGAINTLWKSDRTYIVASETSNCEGDWRGPQESKYCRPGDPHVYYAYMIPKHGSPFPQVWLPLGHDKLSSYDPALSLGVAMESSIRAYYTAGFNYEDVRLFRWSDAALNGAVAGNTSAPFIDGPKFEGTFTIPVCYSPYGMALSRVKSDKARRYPCKCGRDGGPDETAAFANATGYRDFKKWKEWCGPTGRQYSKY